MICVPVSAAGAGAGAGAGRTESINSKEERTTNRFMSICAHRLSESPDVHNDCTEEL